MSSNFLSIKSHKLDSEEGKEKRRCIIHEAVLEEFHDVKLRNSYINSQLERHGFDLSKLVTEYKGMVFEQ